jgi:beta-phosphoglucomutase-like phosphatase (HAD superfamily)
MVQVPMSAAHAVILDFNGTLAEDEAVLIGIYEELLWEHGVAFDPAEYHQYAGIPDHDMFGRLFEAHGRPLEADTLDRLLQDRIVRYRSAVSKDHPVAEDTIDFVRTVAAEVPVAIAPERTVVLEDATDGAVAARAAGMRCVAIRGRAYDERSGVAELVVDRLTADLARALLDG